MQEGSNSSPPLRLGALIAEGYLNPRQSMARILSLDIDEGDRLLMVAIGIVVSCFGVAFTDSRDEEIGVIVIVFGYLLTIIGGLLQYRFVSWLVGIISREMGGAGRGEDNYTLTAWWMLVTAPLPIIMMVAMRNGNSGIAVFVLFIVAALTLVLLAAYITEVHRFRSTGRVIGAMVALLMVFSFVIGAFLPAAQV